MSNVCLVDIFFCRLFKKNVVVSECLDDFVNASAFKIRHSPCYKCMQGSRVRDGYSKTEGSRTTRLEEQSVSTSRIQSKTPRNSGQVAADEILREAKILAAKRKAVAAKRAKREAEEKAGVEREMVVVAERVQREALEKEVNRKVAKRMPTFVRACVLYYLVRGENYTRHDIRITGAEVSDGLRFTGLKNKATFLILENRLSRIPVKDSQGAKRTLTSISWEGQSYLQISWNLNPFDLLSDEKKGKLPGKIREWFEQIGGGDCSSFGEMSF